MEIRKKRQTKKDQGAVTPIYFMGGALGVILLVAAAFFGPEIVFAIQDDIRCSVVVAVNPEELDITSFNTGYETDLYKRLNRFAEGLAAEGQYYVTVQDMEVTPELADWLNNDWRYQIDIWSLVWELRILPEYLYDYQVLRWQRCVIYGNDFAGGVNFILWYLELGIDDMPVVKLLVDGETGGIYGIRTDFETFQQTSSELESVNTYMEQSFSVPALSLWELCLVLAEKYGGIDFAEVWDWVAGTDADYYLRVQTDEETDIGYWDWEAMSDEYSVDDPQADNAYNAGKLARLLQGLSWQVSTLRSDRELHWSFFFPYGENRLEFRMYSGGRFWSSSKSDGNLWFSHMTFGFPDIYERIPAFMEEWK